jgi:hypothetical protein
MDGLCGVLCVALSAGALTLYGLLFNAAGAFVLSGFSITPVNKLGRRVWPKYRRIEAAWDKVQAGGKVSRGDEGFLELAETIGDKELVVNDHQSISDEDELVFANIQFEEDATQPYTNDDTIEVEYQSSDVVEDSFSFSYTDEMNRELAMTLINQRIENGFLRAGSLLLILGFSLQIYAQFARLTNTYVIIC